MEKVELSLYKPLHSGLLVVGGFSYTFSYQSVFELVSRFKSLGCFNDSVIETIKISEKIDYDINKYILEELPDSSIINLDQYNYSDRIKFNCRFCNSDFELPYGYVIKKSTILCDCDYCFNVVK